MVKKKSSNLITIVIVAFVAAMAGGFFTLMIVQHGEEKTSDSSITKVESEDDDKNNNTNVSLKYAGRATLLSDQKLITLNFTNPSKSKKSLDIEIVANIDGEDVTLAKTDKIRPGYKIDSVKYTLDREIPKGDYKGEFVVHFYGEQDQEEVVNSVIEIDVYVK